MIMKTNSIVLKDLQRYGRKNLKNTMLLPLQIKYLYYLRMVQTSKKGLKRKYYHYKLLKLSQKTGIQIPADTQIGEGLYLGHCGSIIINSKAKIGKNCNIATGVTIGQTNRGKNKGYPTIGNDVWIGTNAVIVGNVTIGDDVLIAPLAYVNFDVPSHSIVIGNPGKIIHRDNATEAYINNRVE